MFGVPISALLLLVTALTATVSPVAPIGDQTSLTVTDSGLGMTFHPGDTAIGYMTVSNDGNAVIHDIRVTLTIYPDAMLGFPAAYKKQTFNVELAPGQSRRIEYSQAIPSQVAGISTIGHYRLDVRVEADDRYVTTLQRSVDIVSPGRSQD